MLSHPEIGSESRPFSSPSRFARWQDKNINLDDLLACKELTGNGPSSHDLRPLLPARPVQTVVPGAEDDESFLRQPSLGVAARSQTAHPPSARRPIGRSRPALTGSLEDSERCGVCSKEDFWLINDAFDAMDRRGAGAIRRADYVWALSAHGTSLDFHKTVRKAGLHAYFRGSSEELTFEAFVKRVFPSIAADDVKLIVRWATLRKARGVLTKPEFEATSEELMEVFGYLDEDSSGTLSLSELVRADILERKEIYGAFPSAHQSVPLTFDEFCLMFRNLIVQKYVNPDRPAPTEEALARERLCEAATNLKKRFRCCTRQTQSRRSSRAVHPSAGPAPLGPISQARRRALRSGTISLPDAASAAAAVRTRDESNDRHATPSPREADILPKLQHHQGIAGPGLCGRKVQHSTICLSQDALCGPERAPTWRTLAVCAATVCAF